MHCNFSSPILKRHPVHESDSVLIWRRYLLGLSLFSRLVSTDIKLNIYFPIEQRLANKCVKVIINSVFIDDGPYLSVLLEVALLRSLVNYINVFSENLGAL
jgi:hypothetical protein